MIGSITGSCLCGAVAYEVRQPVRDVIACHCTDCQKATGTGASHNVVVKTESFAVTRGEPRSYAKVVDSGRTLSRFFCGDCGSPLFSRRHNAPEITVLRAGTLNDRSGLKLAMDIWTGSAVAYSPCDPSVPQHEGNHPPPKPD